MSQAGQNNKGGGGSNVEQLTPDVGGPVTAVANNIDVLGAKNGSIFVMETYNVGNELFIADQTYLTPFVVDPSSTVGAKGTFTTITAALAAIPVSPGRANIFIRPGTYSESFSIANDVCFSAFPGDDFINIGVGAQVRLTGTITCNAAADITFNNINFTGSIVVSGSGTTSLQLQNCSFYMGVSPISFTNSQAGSSIIFSECLFRYNSNLVSPFASSSPGTMRFLNCSSNNSFFNSTVASTISAGTIEIDDCSFDFPITASSTARFISRNSKFDCSAINTTALTIGGSGTSTSKADQVSSGSASAISIGSNLTATDLTVNSTNTNAITGAGTLSYTPVSFTGSSSTVNTSTQTALGFGPFTVTDGTLYYDGSKPVTGATGTAGQVWTSNGTGVAPTMQGGGSSVVSFYAQTTSAKNNVTGNGVDYQIVFDTASPNNGSALNTSTGLFTAPVTGIYQFNSNISLTGLAATQIGINYFKSSVYGTIYISAGSFFNESLSGAYTSAGSVTINMTAADTMSVHTVVFNGTQAVNVDGQALNTGGVTSFSGFKVG